MKIGLEIPCSNTLQIIMVTGILLLPLTGLASGPHSWSKDEVLFLKSLWIGSLPQPPLDPSNSYSDNEGAARLGKKLFFDTRFSKNGKVSCGTCHLPEKDFTDALPLARGLGTTGRRTMTLIGVAYNSWFFWDGRKDSLWSQALGPLESPVEHGISRTLSALIISSHYRDEYEAIFKEIPDVGGEGWPPAARPAKDDPAALKEWVLMGPGKRQKVNRIFVNMGKAIGAYVRTIMPGPSRFDSYVDALLRGDGRSLNKIFSDDEAYGLKLFIGKAQCLNCHNGPLFTNGDFHDIGLSSAGGSPGDRGRADGITAVLMDEFNCAGPYSDADIKECLQLRFINSSSEIYLKAFKTPTLRNVSERPPYMHDGKFSTLTEVLKFYNRVKSPEINHDNLTEEELFQLEAFLKTLTGKVRGL